MVRTSRKLVQKKEKKKKRKLVEWSKWENICPLNSALSLRINGGALLGCTAQSLRWFQPNFPSRQIPGQHYFSSSTAKPGLSFLTTTLTLLPCFTFNQFLSAANMSFYNFKFPHGHTQMFVWISMRVATEYGFMGALSLSFGES